MDVGKDEALIDGFTVSLPSQGGIGGLKLDVELCLPTRWRKDTLLA